MSKVSIKQMNNKVNSNFKNSGGNTFAVSSVLYDNLRASRYELQEREQKILQEHTADYEFKSCVGCGKKFKQGTSTVKVLKSKEHKKAMYGNLLTCNSKWVCPVCSVKFQTRSAKDIDTALQQHISSGGFVVLASFTHAHSRNNLLRDNIEKHNEAMRSMKGGSYSKYMKSLGLIGTIVGSEATFGLNGWHWHQHFLYLFDKAVDCDTLNDYLSKRWLEHCKKAGFKFVDEEAEQHFLSHAVDVRKANKDASKYLCKSASKWTAGRELASSHSKKSRSEFGVTPFELLVRGTDEDIRLFVEYARATKGRDQIRWSRKLKARFNIAEKTDDEIIEEQEDTAELIAELSPEAWSIVLEHGARAKILSIAENYGFEGLYDWFLDYNVILERPLDRSS